MSRQPPAFLFAAALGDLLVVGFVDAQSQAAAAPLFVRPLHAMSWKAEHHKIYEARVVTDALARLAKRFDLATLPFTGEELQTLATRARESFRAFSSQEKQQRLARYKTHLAGLYGEESVGPVWAALVEINNEIGYEEK